MSLKVPTLMATRAICMSISPAARPCRPVQFAVIHLDCTIYGLRQRREISQPHGEDQPGKRRGQGPGKSSHSFDAINAIDAIVVVDVVDVVDLGTSYK